MAVNKLFYGDNLDVLREHVPSESIDLIYLDPPFNSQASQVSDSARFFGTFFCTGTRI